MMIKHPEENASIHTTQIGIVCSSMESKPFPLQVEPATVVEDVSLALPSSKNKINK
jgi:hypothetical protein